MPTTEIARRTSDGGDAVAEAKRISKSLLVPEDLANDAASAEYIMAIGRSLGIDPASAFQHIYVFPAANGRLKAGMSAHLMHALALQAGHELKIEGNAVEAKAVLIRYTSPEKLQRFQAMREEERRGKLSLLEDTERLYKMERDQIRDQIADLKDLADLGDEDLAEEIKALRDQLRSLASKYDFDKLRKQISETKFDLATLARFECTWTLNRATKAGLATKDVWQGYGPEMLKSRAKVGAIRDGAIDVILGVRRILGDLGVDFSAEANVDDVLATGTVYTPEELGADVNEEGAPLVGRVVNVTAPGASTTQDRMVAIARELIEGKGPEQILTIVGQIVGADKSDQEKLNRLDSIGKAVDLMGISESEITHGDEILILSDCIQSAIDSLAQSSDD